MAKGPESVGGGKKSTSKSADTALGAAFEVAEERKKNGQSKSVKASRPRAKKKVEKTGFYTGTYRPGTPTEESRLPYQFVRGVDGRSEESKAADETLGDLTEKYLNQANADAREHMRPNVEEHERAMNTMVEEELAGVEGELEAQQALQKAEQAQKKVEQIAAGTAKLKEGRQNRKEIKRLQDEARILRHQANFSMDRKERMGLIARAEALEEQAQKREEQEKPVQPESQVPDGIEAEVEDIKPEGKQPDEILKEMPLVDAAVEPSPNSRTEQEAKLRALYTLKAKYGLRPSSLPYAAAGAYEIPTSKPQEMSSSSTSKESPATPESVAYDPASFSPEEAARIYQGGIDMPPAAPTPEPVKYDPEKFSPETAARIYQSGMDTAPVMPPPEMTLPLEEKPNDDGPIVMLNPVLSRQAGMKKNLPKFVLAPDMPKRRLEGKTSRIKGPRERPRLFAGLGIAGVAAGLAALFAPSGEKHPEMKDTRARASAERTLEAAHHEVSASIEKKGEGADKLYERLLQKLRVEYPDLKAAPELVQQLFAFKSADEFSQRMGFEKLPNSIIMRRQGEPRFADTLKVSSDGKTLVYVDSEGKAHALWHMVDKKLAAPTPMQEKDMQMRPYGFPRR